MVDLSHAMSDTLDRPTTARATHEVLNQVPPLVDVNLFELDLPLQEALEREGGGWAADRVHECGAVAGSAAAIEHARRADRNQPRLVTHDRFGHRVDLVDYDPSWHWLLGGAVERAIHALPWRESRPGAHVARAALEHLYSQLNAGVMCPVSMTYSAVPALRHDPELAAEWEPRLTSDDYARGALCGMAMTEKQGGSDVRAGTTQAVDAGGGAWELTGHKWFCSHPMCDVFLVLAQTAAGGGSPSCFVVERGPGMELQRLKDKLGTRSLASGEVEFRAAPARLLGPEGRGVATIIDMVTHTRLDCVVGTASAMRRAVAEAVHHARHRRAFGARLADQPLMANVLADLALESEAATATALRLARAYDEDDAATRRFGTAVLKYWICKRSIPMVAEALECLGGNGYVEEAPLATILRDVGVNGIWEGSGNVMTLDVLRAMAREPEGLTAFLAECELARGADARLDAHLDALPRSLAGLAEDAQWQARRLVEDLALAFQASLLVRCAPGAVADAFCAGRLGVARGRAFGSLPRGIDAAAVVARVLP